jgi:hypothetical protein
MDPCPICGAAHEPAAAGEVCSAACIRALVKRVEALEPKSVDPSMPAIGGGSGGAMPGLPVNVPLGGGAGGSGGMK